MSFGEEEVKTYWHRYYWLVMAIVGLLALLIHFPWRYQGDLLADLAFVFWTGAMFLASQRWPKEARLIHSLGLIPLLAAYVAHPSTSMSAEYKPCLYVLLAAFPIFTAAAMASYWGLAVAAILAAVSGLISGALEEKPLRITALFFWVVMGLIGLGYYYVFRELEKTLSRLWQRSLTDPLTGLRNRRALEEDFNRYQALAKRENKRLTLILWDINNLKKINDIHGHAAGDKVLNRFADVLRRNVRAADGIYRIGGDEFATLHLGLSDPDIIRDRVRSEFPWVSSGWADATDTSLDSAYKIADKKMYAQKRSERKTSELPPITKTRETDAGTPS